MHQSLGLIPSPVHTKGPVPSPCDQSLSETMFPSLARPLGYCLDFLKVLSNNSSMLVSPLDLSRLTSLALAFATSPLEGNIKSSQGLRKGRLVASLSIVLTVNNVLFLWQRKHDVLRHVFQVVRDITPEVYCLIGKHLFSSVDSVSTRT